MDATDDLDLDSERAVPGLSSISMAVGGNSSPSCIALAFVIHGHSSANVGNEGNPSLGPRQVAIVSRHDRSRRRGLRVDVNVTAPVGAADSGFGDISGERPPAGLIEELEESSRRGGTFGMAGKVWSWLTNAYQRSEIG